MPTATRPPRQRGDEPTLRIRPSGDDSQATPAGATTPGGTNEEKAIETVRLRYKGVMVQVNGLPQSRKVPDNYKNEAAGVLGADPGSVSMSSKLWNCKETAVKELRQVLHEISHVFHHREWTLPSSRPGLRLIRRDALKKFHARMLELEAELQAKAAALEHEMPTIIEKERKRRGDKLFEISDYAFQPTLTCSVEWSFPMVLEDRELMELDESIYHAEIERVREELRTCVRRAEEEMMDKLYEALRQASSRLGSDATGDKIKFQNSTVNKLFDELNYISAQMKENHIGGDGVRVVAEKLQSLLKDQDPEFLPAALRRDDVFREQFGTTCQTIAATLLESAVAPPRRSLLRRKVDKKLEEKKAG